MKALKMTVAVLALAGLGAAAASAGGGASAAGQTASAERALALDFVRGAELGVRVTDASAGGVQIEDVQPGSAAEKAGLKRGDLVVEFDGERVRSGRQFGRLVQETPPGRSVKATIVRDGKREELQVTPAEGRERFALRDLDRLRDLPFTFDMNVPGIGTSARLGVEVDELTPQLAEYFGAKKGGVLVTTVADGSAASRAGLKAGDVIASIDGAAVASRNDLVRGLRKLDGDGEVSLGIVRDRKELTVTAKIEAPRRTLRRGRPA